MKRKPSKTNLNSPINIFLDTSVVNNILDIDRIRLHDTTWKENIKFIRQLVEKPVALGEMVLYVNPSVRQQINNTNDAERKKDLITKFNDFRFEEFNLTIFPFTFPATFITEEQSDCIDDMCGKYPNLKKDRKIIADSAFNEKIDVLLTTDKKLAHQVCSIGKVRFMIPEELWDYYIKLYCSKGGYIMDWYGKKIEKLRSLPNTHFFLFVTAKVVGGLSIGILLANWLSTGTWWIFMVIACIIAIPAALKIFRK